MGGKRRGCWTCKGCLVYLLAAGRRILCDRTFPVCQNCSRSNRTCQGFDLRLAWPKATDRQRAFFGPAPRNDAAGRSFTNLYLVNSSVWDMKLHHQSNSIGGTSIIRVRSEDYFARKPLPASIQWYPSTLDTGGKDLLQYFDSIVSKSLTIFDSDRAAFRGLLIRLALSDNTVSSTAVLQSLLALSSLHRHGVQRQAIVLQGSALEALAASARRGIGAKEGIQHVAASMLLCSFEVQQPSATSPPWLWYVCGAKSIMHSVELGKSTQADEYTALLSWVCYNDALARFSLRHWRRPGVQGLTTAHYDQHVGGRYRSPPVCTIPQMNLPAGLSHQMLDLLSEISDMVVDPSDPRYHSDEYDVYLQSLESRLTNLMPTVHEATEASATEEGKNDLKILELFRLGAIIYFERAARNFSGQSTKLDQWTEMAFAILADLDTCNRPFPLFILGCEARTDDRRIAILDLIAKTEKSMPSGGLDRVKHIIQSIWIQDDLEVGHELDYMNKLSLVLSASETVPSFV